MAHRDPSERINYLTALCRTVPYHIVEAVLREPSERSIVPLSLEGTVMFADLVGFTSMCEGLATSGQEGLSRLGIILSGLFEQLLEEAVFPYRGYVVHFGGDSMTVVFRDEEHALRAAAAALTAERLMHGEVGRLVGSKNRALMLRTGLASGNVRIPIIGDMAQRLAVCSGPVAHRALAMQNVAPPNAVMVDASTLALLEGDVEVIDRKAEGALLRALRRWPTAVTVEELGDRVKTQADEKIALLEPFVPAALAGRLMSMPVEWRIEGELRSMVIMFTELWGLDETSASNLDLATDICRSMARAFRKYGGVISKVDLAKRGHRMMVLFGLHRPADNDPERAVLAALEATTRVRGFTAANNLGLSIRTGIHAGRVYFGAIGSSHKHDITIVGDAVNTAARATSVAEPFEILVTDAVLQPLRRELEFSPRAPILVKGKSEPLALSAIHSASPSSAHYVRKRAKVRPLAGREQEITELRAALECALAGAGSVLGICGERGSGKSALLAHVVNHAVERGVEGIVGRCRYATRSEPLAPAATMFAAFLGIGEHDSEVDRRERIRTGLAPYRLERGAPELMALLQPVRRPDGTTETLIDLADSDAREGVLGSIVEFVGKRIAQEPLIYLLEDLQLADSLTLQLVARLAPFAGTGKFLFLTTFRPDPVLREVRQAFGQEWQLANLGVQAVEELVRRELGVAQIDPDLLVFLWQRTEGNPGHVIEIVRFLQERALLRVRGERVSPAEPGLSMLEDVVPGTLAQVALARLDELGAVERRVLRVASAIGRRFGRAVLEVAAAMELKTDHVNEAVETLQGQGVIVPSAHEHEGLMFRDSVTRAVTYGTIPDAERRALHRRIADAMENVVDGGGQSVAMLAMHRERAGQDLQALLGYERAARSAMRSGLEREVMDLVDSWERVFGRLVEEDRPEPLQHVRMRMLRFVAASRRGHPAQTVRLGRQLLADQGAYLDPGMRLTLDFWMGQAQLAMADWDKAQTRLARVLDVAQEPVMQAEAHRLLARIAVGRGQIDVARQELCEAAQRLGVDDLRQARLRLVELELAGLAGHRDEAETLARNLHEVARSHRQAVLNAETLLALGRARLACDAVDEGSRALHEAVEAFRSAARPHGEAQALAGLGRALMWSGRLDEARRVLEKGLALAEDVDDRLTVAEIQVFLGAAIGWTRDPAEGMALSLRGFETAVRIHWVDLEVTTALVLLRTAELQNDVDTRERALATIRRLGRDLQAPLFRRLWREHQERMRLVGHVT